MDIMDMNVLDEADIDNSMIAEDDEYYESDLLNTFSNQANADDFADSDALKSESEEVSLEHGCGEDFNTDASKFEINIYLLDVLVLGNGY